MGDSRTAVARRPVATPRRPSRMTAPGRRLSQARLAAGRALRARTGTRRWSPTAPSTSGCHGPAHAGPVPPRPRSHALAAYHRLRRPFDDDLGIEPSPFLRDLQTAISTRTGPQCRPPVAWPGPAAPNAVAPTTTAPALPAWPSSRRRYPALPGAPPSSPPRRDYGDDGPGLDLGTAGVGKTAWPCTRPPGGRAVPRRPAVR